MQVEVTRRAWEDKARAVQMIPQTQPQQKRISPHRMKNEGPQVEGGSVQARNSRMRSETTRGHMNQKA